MVFDGLAATKSRRAKAETAPRLVIIVTSNGRREWINVTIGKMVRAVKKEVSGMSGNFCRQVFSRKGLGKKVTTAILALDVSLASSGVVSAHTVPVAPTPVTHSTTVPSVIPNTAHHTYTSTSSSSTSNINLSSTSKTIDASSNGVITIGSSTITVHTGQTITPAEALALSQVVQTGHQQLLLGALGNATGGILNLTGSSLNSLVIPKGVTVLDNVSSGSALSLSGNLTNAGSLYVYSTNASSATAPISAQNIYNLSGGILSSALPSSNAYGITGSIPTLSLNLTALNNIVNAGLISSSGNLTLSAAGSIMNSPAMHVSAALLPTIQAVGNVNLSSNNIVNAGLVNSTAGNININAANNNTINVNNTGGTIQALLGDINIRNSAFNAAADVNIIGGNLLSQNLNINSGSGTVNINVNEISGQLNINAGQAHTLVSEGTLDLGTMNLSGDPSFFNLTGSINITGNLDFSGQDLAIVAQGDITSAAGITLDTSSTTQSGGNITLIAGANFTSTDNTSSSSTASGSGDSTSTLLTITGGSVSGGMIDLNSKAISSLTSSSTSGSGGNITLVAYTGSESGSGTITLPTSVTLNSSGASGFTNGNVTIIGGASSASGSTSNAITVGGINASGAGIGGNILIASAAPVISVPSGPQNVQITNGSITNGATFTPGTTASGNIVIGGTSQNITTDGSFTATTSGGLTTTSAITAASNITLTAGSSTTAALNSKNGAINITTSGNITSNGTMQAGGAITLTTTSNGNIQIDSNVSAGGAVAMTANGTGSITTPNQLIADPVVGSYPFGAAATPNGQYVYVPNDSSNTVSVISTATNTVIATIALTQGTDPKGAVVSPDGSSVYIVSAAGGSSGIISVISTATNTVTSTITISPSNSKYASSFDPQLVAVSTGGATNGYIYVLSDYGTNANQQLTIINPANPTNQTNVTLTGMGNSNNLAGAIAINPQGTLAYIANSHSNNITVVNLATNTVSATISLSSLNAGFSQVSASSKPSPVSLAFDSTGTVLYVGESDQNFENSLGQVVAINTNPLSSTFNQIVTKGSVYSSGYLPQALAVSPAGIQVFVNPTYVATGSNFAGEVEVVLNPLTLQIVGTPTLGDNKAPDGYGSNTFATVVSNTGSNGSINNVQVYIASPTHDSGTATVSVLQTPTIQGYGVTLKSGSGAIEVNYDAEGQAFSANTSGSGSIVVANVGTIASTVAASSAGSSTGTIFELGTIGSINITGPITASSLISIGATANNASISINGNIGSATTAVQISTSGTGAIIGGTGIVKGSTISLFGLNGDLGTSGGSLQTATSSLTASTGGSLFVTNTTSGALSLLASVTGSNISVSNTGSILPTTNSTLSATDIALTVASGSTGSIVLPGRIGSPNVGSIVDLAAGGTGTITQAPGTFRIIADTVDLSTASGSIGTSAAAPLRITSSNLSAQVNPTGTAAPSVFLNNVGDVDLGVSSAKGTFSLVNAGSISVTGAVSSAATITLQAQGGNIDVGANIGSPTVTGSFAGSVVTLNANSFTNTNGVTGGVIQGKQATLTSLNGGIGTSTDQFFSSVTTLTLTSAGGAYITNPTSNASTLTASTASSDLFYSSGGQITVSGALKATNVDLGVTSVTSEALIIGGNLGTSETGTTTLSDSSGNITQTAGTILSSTLNITAQGNVGTATVPLRSTSSELKVTGTGPSNIFLSNTGNLTLNNASAGGVFQLSNTGGITISTGSTVQAGTSITLTATGENAAISQADSNITTLFSPVITLKSGTGAGATIGSSSNAIDFAASSIHSTEQTVNLMTVSGGAIYLGGSNSVNSALVDVNLIGSSTAATNYTLNASNNIVLSNGGKITVTGGQANLTAQGSITQDDATSKITSTSLSLSGTGIGSIISGQALETQASSIGLISTNGDVWLNNTGAMALAATASNNNFLASASGSITVAAASNITANNIEIHTDKGSGGSIIVGASLGASNNTGTSVVLSADGAGSITVASTSDVIKGDIVAFNTTSTPIAVYDPTRPISFSGSVGSSGTNINVLANTLSANTTLGSVYLNNSNTGTTTLATSFAGGTFSLINAGTLNINGSVTANTTISISNANNINVNNNVLAKNVTLTCTGTNDSIYVAGNIGSGGGAVNLTATGTGTITSASANDILPASTQLLLGGASTAVGNSGYLFVPNDSAGTIAVYDKSTNTLVTTINLDAGGDSEVIGGMIVSSDGNTLYVAVSGTNHGIALIDISTPTAPVVSQTISMPSSATPQAVALSADGTTLYVVSVGSSSPEIAGPLSLNSINVASQQLAPTTIALDTQGYTGTGSIVVSGTTAYISNSASKSVSVFNLSTNKATGTISLSSIAGENPIYLTLNKNSGQLYAVLSPTPGNASQPVLGAVAIINTSTNKVTSTSSVISGTTINLNAGNSGDGIGYSTAQPIDPSYTGNMSPTITTQNPLLTNATILNANSAAGDLYLSNGSTATISVAAGASNTISLFNNGSITIPSGFTTTGGNISLTAIPGSNGGISIGGQFGSGGTTSSVTLSADGSANITMLAGSFFINANTITLNADNGNIGSAATPLRTTAATLSASSGAGSVYISNTGDLSLGSSNAYNTFQLTTVGNLSIAGDLANATNIILTATAPTGSTGSGNIDFPVIAVDSNGNKIGANIGYDADPLFGYLGSNITLNAGGAITNTSGTGTDLIRGSNVTINANGSIGTNHIGPLNYFDQLISTSATNLKVNSSTGSAYIDWEQNTNISGITGFLQASTAGDTSSTGTIGVYSTRPMQVVGNLLAQNVNLEIYSQQSGNITISANIGSAKAPTISTTLLADGANSILQTGGIIYAATLEIGGMNTGNIGTAAQPITTSNVQLFIGGSLFGNTYLSNTSSSTTSTLTIDASVSTVGTGAVSTGIWHVVSNNNITVNSYYNSSNTPMEITVDTSSTSNALTMFSASGLSLGSFLSGSGLSSGTVITTINPNVSFTGDITNGTTTILNIPSTAGLSTGYVIVSGTATSPTSVGTISSVSPNVSETGYTTSTGTTSSNSNIVSVSSISNVNTGTEINSSLFPSGTVVSFTNSFVPFNGTYLNASNTVTVTSSTTGLTAGVVVTGAGIPSGTTIQSISGNTVTLSNNTTAQSSGSGSLVQSAYVTLSNTNTSTSTGLNTTSVNFYGSATLSGTVNTTSGSQIALNQEARVVLSSTPTTSVPGNTLVDVAPLSGNQVYIQSTAASGNINVSTPITASTRELMTLGGTISAKSATDGDTVKIMVKVGSTSEPVSYLVKSTDSSLQNIADGLAAAINSDQILQNLGVTAVIDSNSSSMAAPVSLGTTIVFNSTNTSPITYTSSVSATTGKPTETISATQISTGLVTLISGSTGSITSGPVTTSAPLPVTTTASVINAPVISLSSGSGGVGTGTGSNAVSIGGLVSPINYTGAANTVAATAAGTAGAIYLATTGTETLLTSKAGSIFSIQNIAPLTVAAGATISAPSITIQGAATDLPQNPTNANIIINGILGTSTSQVSVSTTDSSTITTSGTGKIVGASVTLSSTAGDIGSSTQNALVTTPSLTISATAGSAYAQDTSAVTLNSSSAGTSLSLLDVSNISAATGGTTLTAPTLILTSSAGSIGTSTASFSINATNLTANAAANVYLADISTSAVTLGTSAAKSGTFQLTTSGDMTTGALTGATIKLISAGALTLGGNLGASTSNITLSAAGLVSQAASTDLLNSASLTVNSSGGDVQLINTNLLNLLSASGGNIDITANNGLNIKGSVVGSSSVDLSTNNSSTGNISIAGNISETGAGGSVTLQSVGAGTISKSIATAVITAPTVTLVTAKTTGTIGSSTAPILTATQALNISSGSSAAVSNTSASALNLGTITTGGALSITDSSPTLNFTQNVTVGISTTVNTNILTVVEKTGNISINSGATVAVNGGKAVIQDLNTSNGTITIDGTLSTQVSATSAAPNGNVTLVIGNTVPTIGTALTTSIPNVTINPTSPGQVLLASGTSASAISGPANTPNATLNATRRNIIISSANAASIILGSNAIVTADPPALTGVSIAANKATLVGGLLSLTNGSTSNTVTGSTASANNSGAYTSQPILQVSAPVLTSLATALSSAPVLFNAATTGSNLSSGPNANASAHASSHNDAQASIDSASTSQDLTDNDEISYSNSNSNIFNSAALNSIDSSKSNSEASPLRGHVSGSGSLFSKTLHNSATRIVTLTNGATMYNPDHDTTLETPFGKVHVGAKAVIIIVLSKNGMSLFNVHDEHRDDVRLEINGSILPISIAEHATIIRDKRDFADLNPLESITHREVNATALPGGMQLIQSQFSILSALSGIKPLRAMAHSSNPEDRKLIQGLVKDAAVIMQTKAGNGAYHRVSSAKQSQKLALAN